MGQCAAVGSVRSLTVRLLHLAVIRRPYVFYRSRYRRYVAFAAAPSIVTRNIDAPERGLELCRCELVASWGGIASGVLARGATLFGYI